MSPSFNHQQQHLRTQSSGGGSPWAKMKAASKAAAGGGPLAALENGAVSFSDDDYFHGDENPLPLVWRSPAAYESPMKFPIVHRPGVRSALGMGAVLRVLFPPLQMLLPTCHQLSVPSLPSRSMSQGRRRVTGTLYGHRRGRVNFAVQDDPSSEPLLLFELAVATGQLVKEMASGNVRVLLECERQPLDAHSSRKHKKKKNHQSPLPDTAPASSLWEEPVWTMFCNGRRSGYAVSHPCGESDLHVLRAVRAVSAGAGVLPAPAPPASASPVLPAPPSTPFLEKGKSAGGSSFPDGGGDMEVMYMRARFERVAGSKDSEAFYMMSPEGGKAGTGGRGSPELSIFLLRL